MEDSRRSFVSMFYELGDFVAFVRLPIKIQ